MASTKLTAPNGASVSVDSSRVDAFKRYGFTSPKAASESKAPAKKSAAKKSSSK